MTAQELVTRLQGVKRNRRGWIARCPAHDDRRASLSVAPGRDGKVLLNCHAGCTTEEVAGALGVAMTELFADEPKRSEPEATYDYCDENGEVLFQVVRMPGKKFLQRRPDGARWNWKLGDVRRVLYRLPELVAAEVDEPVYVVEGEKDVESLRARGFVATCNAGGAGKWRPGYTEALRGREVVILPDNDDPGRAHAELVAESLREVSLRTRVVQLPGLPVKGDVSDWFADGGTAEDLERLVSLAPQWECRNEASSEPEPARSECPSILRAPDMVDAILARANEPWISLALGGDELARVRPGGIVTVMGPTGSGKSSLVGGLMAQHARESGPAVMVSCELPADELAARICGMQCDASWPAVLTGHVARVDMERALGLPRLAILERRNATLDAFDAALAAAREEEPDAPILAAVDYVQIVPSASDDIRMRVTDTMARIDEIARTYRAAVLVISQMSRATARAARSGESLGSDTTDGGAESAAIERYASVTLTIGNAQPADEDGTQRAQLSIGKYRMGGGDRVVPMRYEGRTGRWRADGDARPASDVRAEAQAQRDDAKVNAARLAMVGAADRATEPQTREELRRAAAVSRAIAAAALTQAEEAGELAEVRRKRPRASQWLWWTPARAEAAGVPLVRAASEVAA